eukprot:6204854-Pleurochrysis_carterae.AAC.1
MPLVDGNLNRKLLRFKEYSSRIEITGKRALLVRVTLARSHGRGEYCRASNVYIRPRGSNARGAPRTHEELLVQILHEELVSSAVHCRRARRASLLTA